MCRVSDDAAVRLLVPGEMNQEFVPHPEVLGSVCPLREDGDGRTQVPYKGDKKSIENVFTSSRIHRLSAAGQLCFCAEDRYLCSLKRKMSCTSDGLEFPVNADAELDEQLNVYN